MRAAWMLEIQTTPPVYWATLEGVTDAAGNVYEERLPSIPTIKRSLTDDFFGVRDDGDLTLDVSDVDGAVSAWIAAGEVLGALAIVRRKNLETGAISDRFIGKLEQHTRTATNTVRLAVSDQESATLETPYPRVTVAADRFPGATSEEFALDETLPIVCGATREHVPCRYVEANAARARYRYVAACDLAVTLGTQTTPDVLAACLPAVNAVYRGTAIGASLVGEGEYGFAYDRFLSRPATPSAAILGAGALTGSKWWAITAINGSNETDVTARATASVVNKTVRISWAANPLAAGFRVYRADSAVAALQFQAEIAGGDATSFDDDGALLPNPSRVAPGTNGTGQHTVELLFDRPQFSAQSALAPVLADLECTELAPDAATRGLWWFRRSPRDVSRHGNWLVPRGAPSCWVFQDRATATKLNQAGTANSLTGSGTIKATDYQIGPWQSPVLRLYGGSFSAAAATGMDPGSGSFRIEARVAPDAGVVDNPMTLLARWSGTNGYELGFDAGALIATLGDDTATITVRGATKLQQAWHTVALVVDRTAQTASLYVDDVLDGGPTTIGALGPIAPGAVTTYVCRGPTGDQFGGLVESVLYAPSAARTAYVNGKANQAPNAVDFQAAGAVALMIPDARQTGLNPGASSFSVEAWIKLADTAAVGFICAKMDDFNGYRFYVDAGGTLRCDILRSGANTSATLVGVPTGAWIYVAAVVTREAPGVAGSITAALGTPSGFSTASTVLPAGTPISIDNASDFAAGAREDGAILLRGAMDELRVSLTARTLAELREAWATGNQNPARQVRNLLRSAVHGPGLAAQIDATSWDACDVIDPAIVSTAYALVEQVPLRDHLSELLRVRGYRIGINGAGLWTCDVDAQQAPGPAFGWLDSEGFGNIVDRPVYTVAAVKDSVKTMAVKYRRRRRATGEVDKLVLQTAARTVMPVGPPTPVILELAAARVALVADHYAYYRQQRLLYGRTQIAFEAGEDALALRPGDVLTLTDGSPSSAVLDLPCEVRAMTEGETEDGIRIGLTVAPWNASIYGFVGYTQGGLPTEPTPESTPDYSATYPPPVLNVTLDAPVVVTQDDGRRVWSVTVRWTVPLTPNIRDAVVEWKASSASAGWIPAGTADQGDLARAPASAGPQASSLAIIGVFNDLTAYDVRVVSRNAFGLLGPPVVASVTTGALPVPGDVTGFAQTALFATVQADGRRTWTLQVSWMNPATPKNIRVVISYRIVPVLPTPPGEWIEAGRTRKETFVIPDALDDLTTYDVRAVVLSHSGAESFGVLLSPQVTTGQPSAPALPTGLARKASGHRSRSWAWDKNPEKNIAGYNWMVMATAGPTGGAQIDPPAGVPIPNFTAHNRLVYQEKNLGPDTGRWLRIQAVNRSGVVSTGGINDDGFTDRVRGFDTSNAGGSLITGSSGGGGSDIAPTGTGAIGGDDIGNSEITSQVSVNVGGAFIGTPLATIASASIVLKGGAMTFVIITITGVLNVAGMPASESIDYQLKRDAVILVPTGLLAAIGTTITDWVLPYAISWVDEAPVVGTKIYRLLMKRDSGTGIVSASAVMSVVEYRR